MGQDGHHPEEAPAAIEAADETFGFERLERAVAFLIEEHERLSAEKAALLEELVDREARITTFEGRVASLEDALADERSRRRSAMEGVDQVLSRLERLRASAAAAAGVA